MFSRRFETFRSQAYFPKKKPKKKTSEQTNEKTNHKNDNKDKENSRPVSILFNVSKVFKRIICTQVDVFMQGKLSNLLTGFRKKHSTQCCLIHMLEIWNKNNGQNICIYVQCSLFYQRLLTQYTTIYCFPS